MLYYGPHMYTPVSVYCPYMYVCLYVFCSKTLDHLMEESGCALEHPNAAKFRSYVIAGEWDQVSLMCLSVCMNVCMNVCVCVCV